MKKRVNDRKEGESERKEQKKEREKDRKTDRTSNDIIAGNGSILSLHDYILFIMFKK